MRELSTGGGAVFRGHKWRYPPLAPWIKGGESPAGGAPEGRRSEGGVLRGLVAARRREEWR